jgi:hypothetical protein
MGCRGSNKSKKGVSWLERKYLGEEFGFVESGQVWKCILISLSFGFVGAQLGNF